MVVSFRPRREGSAGRPRNADEPGNLPGEGEGVKGRLAVCGVQSGRCRGTTRWWSAGPRGAGGQLLMAMCFLFGVMKVFWNWVVVELYIIVNALNVTELFP